MNQPLRIWWHELNTWQPEEALAYYGRTLGWTFEPMQLPGGVAYWTARKAGLPVGGIMALDEEQHAGIPSHWMTYMAVDTMDAAIEATVNAGGSLERPAVVVPGVGVLAVVSDPTGALVGLMQPDLPLAGAWSASRTLGRWDDDAPAASRAHTA
ncbi:MAG: VOC family protein [Hyphomicrobiales bacterium]